jgi:curved DNA-binding protein CbpA
MATTGDPWRILGLTPGATADEVRRAYRRLAKENHPDSAGEAALPRFLAIQAAYEAIAAPGRTRHVGGRPTASARSNPPAEPWRADPDRARASGRADGRRPGARPAGTTAGEGAARSSAGARPGSGPGSRGGDGAASSERPRPGPGSSSGSAGRSRRSSRRAPKTAGPYSTSYDAVDEEPFEPGWSGATWYGASSGTYWTINPKEYADPRKHGPEYQARARRSRKGWILDDGPDGEPPVEPDAVDPPATAEEPATDAGPATDPRRARRGPAPGPRPSAWTAADPPFGRPEAAGEARPFDRPSDAPPNPPDGPPVVAAASGSSVRVPILPAARTPGGRAVIALLGWPPLALFAASAIGESTGCGRYAASCAEASSPGTWILAVAILILLLAAPAVARWSAHGTLAILLIGVPVAVILSASGGTNLPDASAPILLAVLAVAYLAGIAYGLVAPRLALAGASGGSGGTGSLR